MIRNIVKLSLLAVGAFCMSLLITDVICMFGVNELKDFIVFLDDYKNAQGPEKLKKFEMLGGELEKIQLLSVPNVAGIVTAAMDRDAPEILPILLDKIIIPKPGKSHLLGHPDDIVMILAGGVSFQQIDIFFQKLKTENQSMQKKWLYARLAYILAKVIDPFGVLQKNQDKEYVNEFKALISNASKEDLIPSQGVSLIDFLDKNPFVWFQKNDALKEMQKMIIEKLKSLEKETSNAVNDLASALQTIG